MTTSFKNWSGSQQHEAKLLATPTTVLQLQDLLDQANSQSLTVRPIGSGHSFVPFWTDDILVSLDKMKGIVDIDTAASQVTLWAGTKLHEIGPPLWQAGFSMVNMGDIDRQSIAGAIGTGTHGTGRKLQNLSNQLASIQLLQSNGELVTLTPEDGDLFRAAQISMGSLGIVTQVTLNVLPAYHLVERHWESSVEECGESLSGHIEANRHFEFFWDPVSDRCDMKSLNPVEPDHQEGDHPVGPAHEIIPSSREWEFNEIEFAVPAEAGWSCFLAVRELIQHKYPGVKWPVEYRTLASDNSLLSTANGRDTVTISAHESNRRDHTAFFLDVENIFRDFDGRPHWGKVHTHQYDELRQKLPEFERFCEIRGRFDPEGRFLNSFLQDLFGTG